MVKVHWPSGDEEIFEKVVLVFPKRSRLGGKLGEDELEMGTVWVGANSLTICEEKEAVLYPFGALERVIFIHAETFLTGEEVRLPERLGECLTLTMLKERMHRAS